LGEKIQRRPLSSTRIASYLADYKVSSAQSLNAGDRLEILIARLLQAPEFFIHWTVTTGQADAANKRIRVDAFTIADHLAYQITAFPPDATLMTAAKNGQLSTLDQVQSQAKRLLESTRGRARVGGLFDYWLRLDKVFVPNDVALTRLGISNASDVRQRLKSEMITETKEFADHVIFDLTGRYEDLLLSTKAVPRSNEMAKILGLPENTRGPAAVPNTRMGLTMRPSILNSTGDERETTINRGIRIRMRLMCESVPPPPGDADTVASNNLAAIDPEKMTGRQIAVATTAGSCTACHGTLNTPGYALGHFGPLGEYRATEKIYKRGTTTLANEFGIDSSVNSNINITNTNDTVADHTDLARLISGSAKGRSCLAQFAFRYSRVRVETAPDSCIIADAERDLAAGASVKDVLVKVIAPEDIFWRGVTP
jgi:hypothetical protein